MAIRKQARHGQTGKRTIKMYKRTEKVLITDLRRGSTCNSLLIKLARACGVPEVGVRGVQLEKNWGSENDLEKYWVQNKFCVQKKNFGPKNVSP